MLVLNLTKRKKNKIYKIMQSNILHIIYIITTNYKFYINENYQKKE